MGNTLLGVTMLKNIGLIIVCNLLMYLIIILILKINERKSSKKSIYKSETKKVEDLNSRIENLEKKLFIQDILNHANLENEINEKI